MDQTVTYEKVYFKEEYRHQFEELRGQYRERTQRAISGRAIDRKPTPNVDAIVYLHDNGDGSFRITTGDFVKFFNHRYGNNDRLGAMRQSIAVAEQKAEKSNEFIKRQRTAKSKEQEKVGFMHRVRSAGRRFSFVPAMFLLMLVLSVVLLAGSSLVLEEMDREVAALEAQVELLGANTEANADPLQDAAQLTLSEGDAVEIYPAEKEGGISMAALLNALAALAKK
ncbi:MAG: hypothetical protein E7644_01130 [Ruminococcaceae bacterium]|nr:hypothetical protein [Oscillospiraceae bacterium]